MFSIFKKRYPTKLFTYFIPAPPRRQSGYREKQVDKIVNTLFAYGLNLDTIATESITSQECTGMWLILNLRPESYAAHKLDINTILDELDSYATDEEKIETVEGLYSLE